MNSYLHGPSLTPLLGETIGENLRRTVERFGDREALVVRSQGYRATYRQLWDQTSALARALLASGVQQGDRVGIWSPNRFEWVVTQYATARIGAILVNINPAYKTSELEYALDAVGRLAAAARPGIPHQRLRGDGRRGRCATVLNCARRSSSTTTGRACSSAQAASSEGDLAARESRLQFDDPINIQYTSGTTGFPKGATLSHHNILNNGYFVGEMIKYTGAGPRLHSRAVLSLLRHGDGQPRLHLARRLHGRPGGGVRPARDARSDCRRALHVALRRADDVHRAARPSALRRIRSLVAAHRHHGRLALPRRSDEAGAVVACTCRK